MSSYPVRRAVARSFVALLLIAVSLLFSPLSLAGPGALEQLTLTRIPGGDNNALTLATQPDGKILSAGYAFFGTKQFSITRFNANGAIDTTFGDAGTRLEFLGPGNAEAHGIGVQSTGRIVAGGFAVSDKSRFGIARFNADGSLDTTFGGGGSVTEISAEGSAALAMAIQGDDKILLAGWALVGGKKVFALARYDADSPLLDTTFGSGGAVIGSAGSHDEQVNALAVQPDGKIVAVGDDGVGVTFRRYNSDGSLDATFGTGGTASFSGIKGGRELAILANGSILAVGDITTGTALGVIRLTANGALDTTFNSSVGGGGFAQQAAGASISGNGLQVQSNGQIVVVGTGASAGPAVAVARFNADGTNDTSFGASGVTVHQFTPAADEGNALAILGNGEIVVAGTAGTPGSHDALLAGFSSTGALDAAFGNAGSMVVDAGSKQAAGHASVLQADGKLVVAGFERPTPTVNSLTEGLVARYMPDGSLDASFGVNGLAELAPDMANAVALQSDGKIVVAGWAQGNFGGNPAHRVAVVRLLANGSLDTGFGSGGVVFVPLGSATEEANAVAIQGDGKIVVGGLGDNSGFLDAMFVRFNIDGSLDTTFGASGKAFVAMSTGADQLNAIAIQADGKILGAGKGAVSGSQESVMLTRLDTNGTVDTAFGTGGVVTTSIGTTTSIASAIALQPDGKIVIGGQWFNPGNSTDDFLVARYNANGTPDGSFGNAGVVTTDVGNHNRLFAITLLPSGKITGAGLSADGLGLVQYADTGALDTSFGSGGSVRLPINAGADIAYSIVQRSDGKLWVSGDGSGLMAAAVLTGDAGTTPIKATATASLVASTNPSNAGQSVTFTLAVSGSAGTPSGTVDFLDGANAIPGCSAIALASGTASCTTSALSSGSHSISARYSGDAAYNAATSNTVTQSVQAPASQFTLSVATSGSGTVTSAPAGINCGATCSAPFPSGTTVSLSAAAASGSVFAGWSGAGCSGTGACSVTMNAAASVTASFSAASTTNPPRLANIATRADVLSGNDVMIGGFIIGGSTNKTVAIVATGPSLSAFGISNPLANPTITLVRQSDSTVIATNDDWQTDVNAAQLQASGFAPTDAHEAGLYINLPPGAYTAIVSGVNGAQGVAVIGVFEVDHPEIPLVNIATRARVLTGNNVMIGGFIIQGDNPQTVAITATGPSLAAFGITNPLANPTLTIVRSSDQSVVATNDDWQDDPNAAQLAAQSFAPTDPREAGIVLTLPPGAYTAIVSGVNGGTGVSVVGVFAMP